MTLCNHQANNLSQQSETVCHTSSISHQHMALTKYRDMLIKDKNHLLYYTLILMNEIQNLEISSSEIPTFVLTSKSSILSSLNKFMNNQSQTYFNSSKHAKNMLRSQNKVNTNTIINKFEYNTKSINTEVIIYG